MALVRLYVNIHIDIVSDKLPHFTPFISSFSVFCIVGLDSIFLSLYKEILTLLCCIMVECSVVCIWTREKYF